jgi:hypothetical protein
VARPNPCSARNWSWPSRSYSPIARMTSARVTRARDAPALYGDSLRVCGVGARTDVNELGLLLGHGGLKAELPAADCARLPGCADRGEQAFHGVQGPVGVVGGECLAVRPPVSGFAQLAGVALLGPRQLAVERPPLLGQDAEEELGIRQRAAVPGAVTGPVAASRH